MRRTRPPKRNRLDASQLRIPDPPLPLCCDGGDGGVDVSETDVVRGGDSGVVAVTDGAAVDVSIAVDDALGSRVAVGVDTGVVVAVGVYVAVTVAVGVAVAVAVGVDVRVGVAVGVMVGV